MQRRLTETNSAHFLVIRTVAAFIDTAVKPEAWYQHYPNQG